MSIFRLSSRSGFSATRTAAAAVEFAVISPVLIMLIFGAIEFGRALMVSNLLTNAAREATRTAVLPNSSNTDVQTSLTDQLTAVGICTTNMQWAVKVNGTVADASTAVTGNNVQVEVTVPYSDVSWLPTSWWLSNATLRGQALMRRE